MTKKIQSNVSLVVLNYNDYNTTCEFVEMIEGYSSIDHIIIVDNFSSDGSFTQLKKLESNKIDVIQTKNNGGYGYGNNFGIKYVYKNYQSEYTIVSNPDVIFEDSIVQEMIESIQLVPNCAIVAPVMKNIHGKKNPVTAWQIPNSIDYVLSASLIYSKLFRPTQYRDLFLTKESIKKVDCIAGSFYLANTKHMLENGMYDENIFLYGEETTLGIKLKRNDYITLLLLNQSFIHKHGVSINKTFNSNIKKHKMICNSRLYILEKYMNVNKIMKFSAFIFYIIALAEYYLYDLFKEMKKKLGVIID